MIDLGWALEEYRMGFLEKFKTLGDIPTSKNLQFNFSTYGAQIASYIINRDLPTPLTIGLNGEWGSGKTTMMKTVQQNISTMNNDANCKDIMYIDFNAWAAEKTDIVVSLFQEISKSLQTEQCNRSQIKEFTGLWASLLADIALRKWGGGMTYKEAKEHFKKPPPSIKDISKQISDMLRGKRLIIFIDDLDRCNASNILELLETIKNVLGIDDLIFCITVDMKQIERAWELQYNSNTGKIEGKEYIEKLFPVVFSLPPKTDDDVGDYLDSLVTLNEKYSKLRSHLIKNLTSNPRKIKRMLNIIFFLIQNYDLDNYDVNQESNIIQECQLHFSLIITWVSLTINHGKISEIIQTEPSVIIPITLFLNTFNSFTEFIKVYEQVRLNKDIFITKDNVQHIFPSEVFTSPVLDILKIIIDEDRSAFKTLKQTSNFIQKPEEFDPSSNSVNYNNKFTSSGYGGVSMIFKKITEKGGLIGA